MLYRHNASRYGSSKKYAKKDATVKTNAFRLAQLPGDVLSKIINPFVLSRVDRLGFRVAKQMITQEYPICGVEDGSCNVDVKHRTVIESSKPLEGLTELCNKQSLIVIIKDTGGLEQQKYLKTVSKRQLNKAFRCVKGIYHQGETLDCLCFFIAKGALAQLKELWLSSNRIGGAGMQAFSTALAGGALASCQELYLDKNQIGDVGAQAFSAALTGGALASCTILDLRANKIGDTGMEAFSAALATGALASVTELWLEDNQIGDAGMQAFSTALAGGAMTSLKILAVDDGPLGTEHPALEIACGAREIDLY